MSASIKIGHVRLSVERIGKTLTTWVVRDADERLAVSTSLNVAIDDVVEQRCRAVLAERMRVAIASLDAAEAMLLRGLVAPDALIDNATEVLAGIGDPRVQYASRTMLAGTAEAVVAARAVLREVKAEAEAVDVPMAAAA